MVVMIVFVATNVCECMKTMMHTVYSTGYVDVGLEKIMLDYFFFLSLIFGVQAQFMSTILYNCCSYMFGFQYIISMFILTLLYTYCVDFLKLKCLY